MMHHQEHPSILTYDPSLKQPLSLRVPSERAGMVASELGLVRRAHPIPNHRLMNNYSDFPHPDPRWTGHCFRNGNTHFLTGDKYVSPLVPSYF